MVDSIRYEFVIDSSEHPTATPADPFGEHFTDRMVFGQLGAQKLKHQQSRH